MHDHGEHIDAAVRYRLTGAVGDAVALGDHLGLARRYDVPPVRVDADAENAGVMGAQSVGVEETQAAAVADEGVQLRVGVVGLQHVVARPRVRIERVSGLRRIIKALAWRRVREGGAEGKRWIMQKPPVNKNRTDSAGASGPVLIGESPVSVRSGSARDPVPCTPDGRRSSQARCTVIGIRPESPSARDGEIVARGIRFLVVRVNFNFRNADDERDNEDPSRNVRGIAPRSLS